MNKTKTANKGRDVKDSKPESPALDHPIDGAHTGSETGSTESTAQLATPRVDIAEAIRKSKARIERAKKFGPVHPLGALAATEKLLEKRSQALQMLTKQKFNIPDKDVVVYQLSRAINTGNAAETIASKIRRGTLSLFDSLDSKDPIESVLNRHIVTMSNCALECQYRSTFSGFNNFDVYARHAEKMTQVLIQLIDARERRRQPKQVVVRDVKVEAGGRAIVGTVKAHDPRSRSDDDDPSDDSAAA